MCYRWLSCFYCNSDSRCSWEHLRGQLESWTRLKPDRWQKNTCDSSRFQLLPHTGVETVKPHSSQTPQGHPACVWAFRAPWSWIQTVTELAIFHRPALFLTLAKSLLVKVSSSEFPAALSIGELYTGPPCSELRNSTQSWVLTFEVVH